MPKAKQTREEREGEGMTYEQWRYKQHVRNQTKRGPSLKRQLDLTPKKRYTHVKRKAANPSVKYRLSERYGDKEQRKEQNRKYPFLEMADWRTKAQIPLADGKTRSQAWFAIRKLWTTIRIANREGDSARKEHALRALRYEQDNLGIKLTEDQGFGLLGTERMSRQEKEYWKWYDEQNGTSYSKTNS